MIVEVTIVGDDGIGCEGGGPIVGPDFCPVASLPLSFSKPKSSRSGEVPPIGGGYNPDGAGSEISLISLDL
jgi:hypothetical protein